MAGAGDPVTAPDDAGTATAAVGAAIVAAALLLFLTERQAVAADARRA